MTNPLDGLKVDVIIKGTVTLDDIHITKEDFMNLSGPAQQELIRQQKKPVKFDA